MKTFSPGFNKASADDGISDGGRIYDFDGMGFEKAGQIAYLAISVGWNYVGMQWGDRAIMIGSATGTAVAMNLIEILPKFLS